MPDANSDFHTSPTIGPHQIHPLYNNSTNPAATTPAATPATATVFPAVAPPFAVSVTAAPLPVPVGEPPLLVVETPDLDTSKTPLSLNCPVFFSSRLSALMLYLPAVVELLARGWNPGMTKLTRSYFPAAVSTLAAMGSCVSGVVVLSTSTRANWDGSVDTEVQVMALVEDRSQVVVVVGEVRRRAVGG